MKRALDPDFGPRYGEDADGVMRAVTKKARVEINEPVATPFSVLAPDCWRYVAAQLTMRGWLALKLTCKASVDVFAEWRVELPRCFGLVSQIDGTTRLIKRAIQAFMAQDLCRVHRINTAMIEIWPSYVGVELCILPDVSHVTVAPTGMALVEDFPPLIHYGMYLTYDPEDDQWEFSCDGSPSTRRCTVIQPDYVNWLAAEVIDRYRNNTLSADRWHRVMDDAYNSTKLIGLSLGCEQRTRKLWQTDSDSLDRGQF